MHTRLSHTPQLAAIGLLASTFASAPAIGQQNTEGLAQLKAPEQQSSVALTVLERGAPVHIQSSSEFVDLWSPSEPLYIKGTVDSEEKLIELRSWISEHNRTAEKNWSVILVERSAGYEYARGSKGTSYGVDAYLNELRDRFITKDSFNALTSSTTGEKNGALLFISLDKDGANRKMLLWTRDQHDRHGVGSGSDIFLQEVFPAATKIIRTSGSVSDAAKYVIGTLDSHIPAAQPVAAVESAPSTAPATSSEASSSSPAHGTSWGTWTVAGLGGLAVAGLGLWGLVALFRSRDETSSSSSRRYENPWSSPPERVSERARSTTAASTSNSAPSTRASAASRTTRSSSHARGDDSSSATSSLTTQPSMMILPIVVDSGPVASHKPSAPSSPPPSYSPPPSSFGSDGGGGGGFSSGFDGGGGGCGGCDGGGGGSF